MLTSGVGGADGAPTANRRAVDRTGRTMPGQPRPGQPRPGQLPPAAPRRGDGRRQDLVQRTGNSGWSSGAPGASRSGFHERFTLKIGVAPLEYLRAWRMEMAKHLLRREGLAVSEVAARLGYRSISTFSTAFSKQVRQSPAGFLRGD